jgi:hypothetical protein
LYFSDGWVVTSSAGSPSGWARQRSVVAFDEVVIIVLIPVAALFRVYDPSPESTKGTHDRAAIAIPS